MLRAAFVLMFVAVGVYYALQGPFYSLLFYIANAYFRPEEWVWVGGWVQSLRISFLVGFYVTILTLFSRHQFVWDGKIALLWIFCLHSLCSTVLSAYSIYSWPYLIEFIKVIVIGYLLIVLITDFAKVRLVILVMALALGLEQAKQGWFYLLTSPGGRNLEPISFLGDSNGVAVGMLMLSPLIIFLRQTTQYRAAKVFYSFLFIGCLYRALSTYSRGAFLACIAMGGFLWLRSRNKVRGLVGMILLLALILPALPDAFWARIDTIQTYEEVQDVSALGRLYFWGVAVKMANANPFMGVGFNSYNTAYNDYDSSEGQYGSNRSVHSIYFGVLAELGYVGLCLYVAILLGALRSCAQVRKIALQNYAPTDLMKSATALESSLVAFAVGGSFVPLQYNEMLWHLVGLSIVLKRLASQYKEPRSVEQFEGQSSTRSPDPMAA